MIAIIHGIIELCKGCEGSSELECLVKYNQQFKCNMIMVNIRVNKTDNVSLKVCNGCI